MEERGSAKSVLSALIQRVVVDGDAVAQRDVAAEGKGHEKILGWNATVHLF
jgi:hypothetical protein